MWTHEEVAQKESDLFTRWMKANLLYSQMQVKQVSLRRFELQNHNISSATAIGPGRLEAGLWKHFDYVVQLNSHWTWTPSPDGGAHLAPSQQEVLVKAPPPQRRA